MFYLPPRQEVITYPISGFNDDLRPGHRRYNFIWYRVADAAQLREMNVDENGVQHEFSVPPPLIRKDLIAQMHADARDIMPRGDARLRDEDPAAVHHADLRFHRAAIVFGRVAMVGDAAANRAPAHGLRRRQGRRRRARRWRRRCATTTTSTPRSRPTTPSASRSATPSCCTAASSAPIIGVNLKTEEDRRMHALLQERRAR